MVKKTFIVVGLLAIVGFGGWYFFLRSEDSGAPQYVTAAVQQGAITTSVTGSGNLAVANSVDVEAEISGEIAEIKVAEGDEVVEGDVLVVIQNNDLDITTASAWTTYQKAQENLSKKTIDRNQAARNLRLLEDMEEDNPDSVTNIQLASARQLLRAAELEIAAAEDAINSTRDAYNEAYEDTQGRSIVAPASGTVISIDVEVGDTIGTAGSAVTGSTAGAGSVMGPSLPVSATTATASSAASLTSLMTIATLDRLTAEITLNEIDVVEVDLGQSATLVFDAIEDHEVAGSVEGMDFIGTNVQGVVNYGVTLKLDSLHDQLRPGMTVDATITTSQKEDVLQVPNAAVKLQGGQHFVQTLFNGQLTNKPVTIGISNDEVTEIVSGVVVGEEVVTAVVDPGEEPAANGFNGPGFPGFNGSQEKANGNGGVRGVRGF